MVSREVSLWNSWRSTNPLRPWLKIVSRMPLMLNLYKMSLQFVHSSQPYGMLIYSHLKIESDLKEILYKWNPYSRAQIFKFGIYRGELYSLWKRVSEKMWPQDALTPLHRRMILRNRMKGLSDKWLNLVHSPWNSYRYSMKTLRNTAMSFPQSKLNYIHLHWWYFRHHIRFRLWFEFPFHRSRGKCSCYRLCKDHQS